MKNAFTPKVRPLVLAVALLGTAPAFAFQYDFGNGIRTSIDTTISYGVSVRTQQRDQSLIGIANGGTSRSVNEDNGDLNFDKGHPFANVVKATTDLEIKYRNWGFFGRGFAFYDFDLHDSNKLGDTGRDRLGKNVVGLDGYIFGTFEPFGHTTRVRAGRQVISWGESTFIPNGINVINPVDVSKLRIPGSELKEAFIPTAGVWGAFEVNKSVALEGFYLTNFDKTRIDPKGSYFSNNDAASDDANQVILSFGRRHDERTPLTNPVPPPSVTGALGAAAQALYGPFDPAASLWINRTADHEASDHGQYGVALRYFAHEFNNTEFGFYLMNYHSRLPVVSAVKGTPSSVLTGNTALLTPICATPALRALCTTGTASYFVEFPENIKLYGVSFNTAGPMGIALQGEYSYRPNQPTQLATPELVMASLGLPNQITGFTQIPGAPAGATAAALVPDGTTIQGWQRLKMSQLQLTGTKAWPNILKSEQLVLVGEAGFTWFHNLPQDQKFAGPGVQLPAQQFSSIVASAFSVQPGGYMTEFSWGYRLAARMDYANMLYGGTVSPRAAFSHDVRGVSPTFNEAAKSASVGVSWDYQRKWVVDTQFTNFFGGRKFCGTDQPPPGSAVTPGQPASWCIGANPLKDRNFYSVSVSYSF